MKYPPVLFCSHCGETVKQDVERKVCKCVTFTFEQCLNGESEPYFWQEQE